MLINCLCGMRRKAHGAQEPRHIQRYVEVASTAQRGDSPAQAINQRFLNYGVRRKLPHSINQRFFFSHLFVKIPPGLHPIRP